MFLVLLSSIFLILSFPNFNVWPLAWIALVPALFNVSHAKSGWKAFLQFYLIGFIFYFASMEWLRHVSHVGWFFVAGLMGFYYGVFGIAAHSLLKRKHDLPALFALPALWCFLEYVRTEIPVWGFGWNLLAYTQAANPKVSFLASFAGAYGISALIVLSNVTFLIVIKFLAERSSRNFINTFFAMVIFASIAGGSYYFGMKYGEIAKPTGQVRLGVVQGNIPQYEKWDSLRKMAIIEKYNSLSRFIQGGPDLIIWPEAAFPGFFNYDLDGTLVFQLVSELKTPLLIGAPHLEALREGITMVDSNTKVYNSAYLIDESRSFGNRYDKIRLVPFGEFIPWQNLFRLFGLDIVAHSLGVSDFTAGREMKVFNLKNKYPFASLICFEDTFPSLARLAVKKGAKFLVVITNDAWFSVSAAPYQHLQASVFRAIENGVPVVRAANTGISAFIDAEGRVLDRVKDQGDHDIFIAGGLSRIIEISDQKTIYQRWGYYFPWICLALFCFIFWGRNISGKIKKSLPCIVLFSFILIKSAAGETAESEGWTVTAGDHFEVLQKKENPAVANEILTGAEERFKRIVSQVSYDTPLRSWAETNRVKIQIYDSKEDFIKEKKAPDWSSGLADYDWRTISSYRGASGFLNSVLPHEIAHLVLFDMTDRHQNVPKWLHEGFALSQEDRIRGELGYGLKDAAAKGYLLPLKMLTIVNPAEQDRGGAVTYYSEAQAFVRFLIDGYGPSRFHEFIINLKNGKSFEESVERAYKGVFSDTSKLEEQFFQKIKSLNK
ncbi:MAG: apolipoprotein N-acyltransferase [Omnitrophica bacterium RIFCSPLOWO2_12_FULL_44_17]|uniref:Apolipoprotein N-acyltransferase n=1 Tax=Candidatus Danuiimicrobium aquiferis TaxID=1801832 RepID=A0A1G1L051_9BACT|nr:MAG: apolipoprotein N-acyltransferase [Omnitrophica bacterium RIFCSPLOWO2_12_FULL_44_17]